MTLTKAQVADIEALIAHNLRVKLAKYKPESKHMPFHYHLLGKDRMVLFSFIQSLNTTFGTSIFEPVAAKLAKAKFVRATPQYVVGDNLSAHAQDKIQEIMNALTTGNDPDKLTEIEQIRSVCQSGETRRLKPVRVDLCVEDHKGSVFLFDLKTAKPNISNFKDFKRTLLEWCAIALSQNPKLNIHSLIAIPYNPHAPKPYQRWTMKGMLDLQHELKVAEDFWDFLGGKGAYQELLNCFERVGLELRDEIDARFAGFRCHAPKI